MSRPSRWQRAAGEGQERPLRWLVVDATPLAKAKAPRWAAAPQAEHARLAARDQPWPRRPLACAAEAQPAATLGWRERRWHRHHRTSTVNAAWVAGKRATRGRPPKAAARPQPQGWRVPWHPQEAMDAIRPRAQRERRCVLATQGLEAAPLAEAERRRASKGPPAAELSFTGATHPAASAPLCLATPWRMAALGGVDWIALRVYPLVERHVRKGLADRGETLPDRPAPSQRPTARTVLPLRRHLAVGTRPWAGPGRRPVTTRNAQQRPGIRLLGDEPTSDGIPHRNSG